MLVEKNLPWSGTIILACLLGCLLVTTVHAGDRKKFNPDRVYTVAFAQDTMSNDWRAAQVRDVETALSKYPFIKFIFTDAEGSSARQALDTERLINDGADVIITSPRNVNTMTPVISRAYKKGIPVILLTRRITNDDYTTFIGADDYEIGRQAADYLAKKLKGKGQIVMLKGVATATTSIQRTKGFTDQIKMYPDMAVIAEEFADYRRNKAIIAMEKILAKNVRFDALYAQSDGMATGARMAMKRAGIDLGSKVIVGIDNIDEAREAIKKGEQDATFTYPTAGKEGAQAAISIIKGEKVAKDQIISFRLVTKENLN